MFLVILTYYIDNNDYLKIMAISFCKVIRFYSNKVIVK